MLKEKPRFWKEREERRVNTEFNCGLEDMMISIFKASDTIHD